MKGQSLRVALPGEMYERAGRWWWRVQLPGEDKAKARPLRAPGARAAANDRKTAEGIAVELWEQAVRQTGARQTTLDCTQKVERLKAQFLEKVRHLTEIVESANARAQAEARARAEIEARLNAVLQVTGQSAAASSAEPWSPAVPQSPAQRPPFDVRADVTRLAGSAVHTNGPEANEEPALAQAGARPERREAAGTAYEVCSTSRPAAEAAVPQPQTGVCECCGATEVPVPDLAPIDSGQLLCPDCLTAIHIDISRIESQALSASHI
jgi:hypothetical protein